MYFIKILKFIENHVTKTFVFHSLATCYFFPSKRDCLRDLEQPCTFELSLTDAQMRLGAGRVGGTMIKEMVTREPWPEAFFIRTKMYGLWNMIMLHKFLYKITILGAQGFYHVRV